MRYELNMQGAEDLDEDARTGDLSSEARARMMVRTAIEHGFDATLAGDTVRVLDEGAPRTFRTMVSLMEWLGY